MDLTTFLGTTVAAFALNRLYEAMSSDRKGAARLRATLLDLDKMEECADEYMKPDSPTTPAYRLPTTFLQGALLWFSDGAKLTPEELRELHELYSDAIEVNRCLDQAHAASTAATNAPEFGGHGAVLGAQAERNRLPLKCQNVLDQLPKARAAAEAAIKRMLPCSLDD